MSGAKLLGLLILGLAALALSHDGVAATGDEGGGEPRVLLEIDAATDGKSALVEASVSPSGAWRKEIYVSFSRGPHHHRQVVSPAPGGAYRFSVRLPEEGRWGIYLRYGPGQAGHSGYGSVVLERGAKAQAVIRLENGYPSGVPVFVQPFGYALFAVIAAAAFAGIALILGFVRSRQIA